MTETNAAGGHAVPLVSGARARNIQLISELFPQVVTESFDSEGESTLAVDFDALRLELSGDVVEGSQERYRLDWPGKRAAASVANDPARQTLHPLRQQSADFDTTRNLFIEGDNLEALKLLQEPYLAAVKLIYIDPPYNTGGDLIYHDDFVERAADYLRSSGQTDDGGSRLVANPESGGRFDSTWLSMIYPRLKLARNLLREDGVICISIDDNELANLLKVMNELFGRQNLIGVLPRVTKRAGKSSDRISSNHDYLVVWGRTDASSLHRELHSDSGFKHSDQFVDERGRYKLNQTLDYGSIQYSRSLDYEIELEAGHIVRPGGVSAEEMEARQGRNPSTGWCWRWSRDLYDFGLRNGFVVVKDGRDGTRIYTKTYENATIVKNATGYEVKLVARTRAITSLDLTDNRYSNDMASKGVRSLFGYAAFDYTKPVALLRTLIAWATEPGSGDLILDFFAGSGTTGQAVLEANAADGGSRRFILVQVDEPIPSSTEAGARGYARIPELTRERLQLASEAVRGGQTLGGASGDIGYRSLRIAQSSFEDVARDADELRQDELAGFVDSLSLDDDVENVLFEVMLRWGLDPASPIEVLELEGCTVFDVAGGALLACFEHNLPISLFDAMRVRSPLRVVVRDGGFANAADRINADQLLGRSKSIQLFTI